jgi:RNA polymerase sigma-70 factor (ECF subfamily)
MVFGLCRLLLRDPVEAEDATQQVFLAAHRSVISGLVPRNPRPWLAAVARNECRARIRSRSRARSQLPLLSEHLPDPVAAAVQTADLDALWQALAELPRRQRKAFLLRELGGLSYRELGLALGVTQPAVESLLFRARKRLREALTATPAAALPTPLRDQLARLLPTFGPSSPATATTKCAAVALGLGLGAAGVAEVPEQSARPHRVRPSAVVERTRVAQPLQRRREARPASPARFVGEAVAFVTHERHSPGRDHPGPSAAAAPGSTRGPERRDGGWEDQHPEIDAQPQPSSRGDDAAPAAPQQTEQPQAQRRALQESVPQPQEEGAPAPAVSRDGSGGDMTHHGDGSGGSSGDGGRDGGDGGSGEQSGGGD